MPKSIPTLCGSIMAEPFSLGVMIHNAAYRALGLDYTFVCFGVDDPERAIAAARTLGIRGLNVSIPYKEAVVPFLDSLDPGAARIGAVNTISQEGGRLTGYNTDAEGAMRALREVTELRGKRTAVLGAGGAAKAVAHGLLDEGAAVTVFNRTAKRGQQLAEAVGANFGGALNEFDPGAFDVLLNATSVGFRDAAASPVTRDLPAGLVVMDVAFIPPRTKLLAAAEKAGCRTVPGTRMLLHQACGQVERYTGAKAPLEAMEVALHDALAKLDA